MSLTALEHAPKIIIAPNNLARNWIFIFIQYRLEKITSKSAVLSAFSFLDLFQKKVHKMYVIFILIVMLVFICERIIFALYSYFIFD